ncbi:MAG: hypothetical protein ABIG87_02270 [Patescibacteria group bacterium]
MRLNLSKNDDSVLDKVLDCGKGSSFDFLKFDEKGKQMKVLERWKYYKDDKLYKSFFKDSELIRLSDEIFGRIDETEILFNNK